MEVRAQQAVDQLLRGGRDGAAALQRGAVAQVRAVRVALAAAPPLRARARQAGAHAHHTGASRTLLLHIYGILAFNRG